MQPVLPHSGSFPSDRLEIDSALSPNQSNLNFPTQVDSSLFEERLLKKLTEKPNDTLYQWVNSFANKLSLCHYNEVKISGIALVNRLLDFPEKSPLAVAICNHLQEFVDSLDALTQNKAENLLIYLQKALDATSTPLKIIGEKEMSQNIETNPLFIANLKKAFDNTLAKTGYQFLLIDETTEKELAAYLADLKAKMILK